jgi:hypothetical protein
VDEVSKEYKVSPKKTFETLEEMTDYLQKLFSGKKVMIEKRPEEGAEKDRTTLNGYISVSDGNSDCLVDYYYECPNCKFVLGIKRYEKFKNKRSFV